MISGIVALIGLLFIWVGFTGRGNTMWESITGSKFTPLG